MTIKSLIKYLSEFPENEGISIIIANPDKDARKLYPVKELLALSKNDDNTIPCLVITVKPPEPLDEFICDSNG